MKKPQFTIVTHNQNFRERSSAFDTKIIHLTTPAGNKVFKFSYENGNAFEHFKGEIFNGDQMSMVFNLTDLGFNRHKDAYLLYKEIQFKQRVKELTDKGIDFITKLY